MDALLLARTQLLLARDEVRYVGEPMAFVVGEDRYVTEDALELIEVDYEPLAVAADAAEALKDGAPLVYPEIANNLASRFTLGFGPDSARRSAPPVPVSLLLVWCGRARDSRAEGDSRVLEILVKDYTWSI